MTRNFVAVASRAQRTLQAGSGALTADHVATQGSVGLPAASNRPTGLHLIASACLMLTQAALPATGP